MGFIKRLKMSDYIILAVVVVVIGVAVAYLVMRGKGDEGGGSGNVSEIEFDMEISDVDISVTEAYRRGVEQSATYGVSNIDTCTLKSVEIKEQERTLPNDDLGEYVIIKVPDKFSVLATFTATVNESDHEFRGSYDLICAGKQLPIHGKGYSMNGYVVDIRVIKSGSAGK